MLPLDVFLLALIAIGLHAVQSYNDWALALMGDSHNPERTRRELEAARREIEALMRIVHTPAAAQPDADQRRLSEEGECM